MSSLSMLENSIHARNYDLKHFSIKEEMKTISRMDPEFSLFFSFKFYLFRCLFRSHILSRMNVKILREVWVNVVFVCGLKESILKNILNECNLRVLIFCRFK